MKQFESILMSAALDDRDHTTVLHTAFFARCALTKTVYLAHVTPTFDLPIDVGIIEKGLVIPVDEAIMGTLQNIISPHRDQFLSSTRFQFIPMEGSVVPEIIQFAVQKSVDLICLGRKTGHDFDTMSDTALKILRKSPCSVCVIPPGKEPKYQRILVPVDFSEHSREALEEACSIAGSVPGSSVTVHHTYEVPVDWYRGIDTYDEIAAKLKSHAETQWNGFKTHVNFQGATWQTRFDLGPNAAESILRAATEIRADLIVLGSHGKTRPAAFLLGHVADTVCNRTTLPVLCVKKKGEMVNLLQALLQVFQRKGP